jgi:hypothetical protein
MNCNTTQNCLSLTANTTPTASNTTPTASNLPQRHDSSDHLVVSPDNTTIILSVLQDSNRISI